MKRENRWAEPDQVGEGWQPIIRELEEQLIALDPDYTVDQIKEKFGGLRYYYFPTPGLGQETYDAMLNLVAEAEDKSYETCEDCGAPGKPGGVGWIRTLCDECRGKR